MKPSSTSARLAELNFLEENLWRSCVFLNVSLYIVCHREHEIARITLEYSSLNSLVRNFASGLQVFFAAKMSRLENYSIDCLITIKMGQL